MHFSHFKTVSRSSACFFSVRQGYVDIQFFVLTLKCLIDFAFVRNGNEDPVCGWMLKVTTRAKWDVNE